MSRRSIDSGMVLGGESRVDLLPPEVHSRVAARSNRRVLVGAVVLTGLVVAGGWGASLVVAGTSAANAAFEQSKSSELIAQQSEFAEVRTVDGELDAIAAAQTIGASTELDWSTFFPDLAGRLPAGSTLTGLALESSSPLESVAQASAPLQGPRVVTVVMDVRSPAVVDVQSWLQRLADVEGFVDATPSSTTLNEDDGSYDISMTLHLDADSYWNRFAADDSAAGDADTISTGDEK